LFPTILVSSDDTTIYFTTAGPAAGAAGSFCRYTVASSSIECFLSGGTDIDAVAQFSDTEYFMSGKAGANRAYYIKMDISTDPPTQTWLKHMDCPETGSCLVKFGDAVINSDQSIVYSGNIIGSSNLKLVFTKFNATDGSTIGVHHASSIACSTLYTMTIVNSNVYANIVCSGSKVLKYDTTLDAFTVYSNTAGGFTGFVRNVPNDETR
jgi:hypothetical protein